MAHESVRGPSRYARVSGRRVRALFGFFWGGALSVACVGETAPPAPAPPSAERVPPPSSTPLPDRDWGVLRSRRFFVELPLPDLRGWHTDDRNGRWLVAIHAASRSALYVRGWREGSVLSHAACEEAARKLRPDLFGRDASELAARRPLAAPEGFDTEAGFSVRHAGGTLRGVAAVSGAKVRQCLVLVYTTDTTGPNAEADLAARLSFFVDRIAARARSLTIDDRVVPIVP